jgi:hypothetical protein
MPERNVQLIAGDQKEISSKKRLYLFGRTCVRERWTPPSPNQRVAGAVKTAGNVGDFCHQKASGGRTVIQKVPVKTEHEGEVYRLLYQSVVAAPLLASS